MKKFLPFVYLLVFACFFTTTSLFSQTTIVSNNGYTVFISVQPKAIIPLSSTCANGYNYNVKLDYTISFSGNNIPASLYTLQGTLGCGTSSHFFDLPNNGGTGTVNSQSRVWNPNRDCATATTATLSCGTVNIEIEGPGISRRTVSFTISNSPLPITLIDFTAVSTNGKVKLNWSTATEINNDYFTIEKSIDGTNWKSVKNIDGAGNSSSLRNYETTDENPSVGVVYYRLKQTDIDGQFTYSTVRSVKNTGNASVDIYPVPNTGNTIFFRGLTETKNMTLSVRDAAGSSVFSTILINTNSVELPSLKSGLYIISLNNSLTNERINLRYIKM